MTAVEPRMTPADFMSTASAPPPMSGNSPWANRYAGELREFVRTYVEGQPRSLQSHLGPSEIGHPCDRHVAGKLAHLPKTNHVSDPWPSFMGTCGHEGMERVLNSQNKRLQRIRFLTEFRVTPTMGFEGHPGTGDGYDADHQAVIDHKFLGSTTMAKLLKSGPPRKYFVQFLLYTLGFQALNLPVKRIALLAWPRTGSSVDGLYVWEHELTDADYEFLRNVVGPELRYRKQWAAALVTGAAQLQDVPAAPDDDSCYFCLAGETEVVTRQGIRPIRELAGGEAELLVPRSAAAARGAFRSVPVRALGEQRLYAVNLRRYRATKTVYATAEHRWVLPDGTRKTTGDLSAGDSLSSVRAAVSRGTRIPVAIAQGFTYGDGARGQGRRPATLAIYDRSTADEHILPYFGPVTMKRYATPGGDKVTHIYGLPRFWKDLPPLDESKSFLLSWLAGYFAADGTVTGKGQATISSADRGSLEFVRDIAAVCGIGHGLIRSQERVGTGSTATTLYGLDLAVRDLPEWFWVLPHQAATVGERVAKAPRTTHWSVISVEATDRNEEVYCATVPEVRAFGLADGLTTGNCDFFRPQAAHDGGTGCPGPRKGDPAA